MKKILAIIAFWAAVLATMFLCGGCGLLSYTPQERNISTKLNVMGCTWEWTSTAKGTAKVCPKCGYVPKETPAKKD